MSEAPTLQAASPVPVKTSLRASFDSFSVAPERKLLMASIGNAFVFTARRAVMQAQFPLVARQLLEVDPAHLEMLRRIPVFRGTVIMEMSKPTVAPGQNKIKNHFSGVA